MYSTLLFPPIASTTVDGLLCILPIELTPQAADQAGELLAHGSLNLDHDRDRDQQCEAAMEWWLDGYIG